LSENNAVEVIRNVIKKNMNLFTREERKEGRVYRAYFGLKTSSEVSPV
jgi:hypothetical protein